MQSAPFRIRLGVIIDAKRQAIGQLIKDAVAANVKVHIAVKSRFAISDAHTYLTTLGFESSKICTPKENPEMKPLHVHSVIDDVPDSDLKIDFDDIYTPN